MIYILCNHCQDIIAAPIAPEYSYACETPPEPIPTLQRQLAARLLEQSIILDPEVKKFLISYRDTIEDLNCVFLNTATNIAPHRESSFSDYETPANRSLVIFSCGHAYHYDCLGNAKLNVSTTANNDYFCQAKIGCANYCEKEQYNALHFPLFNLMTDPLLTVPQHNRLILQEPARTYPKTSCVNFSNKSDCIRQHCGCLECWNPRQWSHWWSQQTNMCRALADCLHPRGICIMPSRISSYEITPLISTPKSNALGACQRIYAWLACLGWTRHSVAGWFGCSTAACLKWIEIHDARLTEGRLRCGQLFVDGVLCAVVVVLGMTAFLIPLIQKSLTTAQTVFTTKKTSILVVPTSELPY